MPLPAMHPTASVAVYLGPDDVTTHASRAGGAIVPSAPVLLVTETMEVEEVDTSVLHGEAATERIRLRLWPTANVTAAYREGQRVVLTWRGKSERLTVRSVLGPWSDGDPDDHVEIVAGSRHGADL